MGDLLYIPVDFEAAPILNATLYTSVIPASSVTVKHMYTYAYACMHARTHTCTHTTQHCFRLPGQNQDGYLILNNTKLHTNNE